MNRQLATSSGRLFAVLFCINVINYADRFTLPAVAPLLSKAFDLDDTRLGLLGTAFLLVYAVAAPPLGALADRRSRTTIVAGGVALWSIATVLTAFCRTFPQLFVVRALIGIGESSYFPPSTTLLADAFPQERRARIMSWWGTATPIGVFLGYGVGGIVGQKFGWQYAFVLVGLPGLLLAALALRLREPARGSSEGLVGRQGISDAGWLGIRLLRIRTLAFAIVSQTFAFFVLGGLSFWLTVYLTRHYGLQTGSAGVIAGGLFVVGGGIGTIAGGYLSDLLLPRYASARMLVPAVGFVLGGICIAFGLAASSLAVFLVAYTCTGILISMYSGPFSALLQDVVPPASRARAVALSLLLAHVFGDAFAPAFLGWLSERLGGATVGLDRAFWLAPVCAIIAGLVALAGCRFVGADRKHMLAHLQQSPVPTPAVAIVKG